MNISSSLNPKISREIGIQELQKKSEKKRKIPFQQAHNGAPKTFFKVLFHRPRGLKKKEQ
jgi:hypothetical protein